MLHLPCDSFDVWVGRWFGREGRRSALFIWMLVVWVVIWSCSVKQVVVPRIAPKAVISLLEASKRSGGLLRALTCYLFYLHLKNSDLQLIQYDLIECVLVSLLYSLWMDVNIYVLYLWLDDAWVVEWNDVYSLPRRLLKELYMAYLFLYMAFALHLIHCIGIWSYVANLWFRPYRYSIVYWA